MSCLSLRPLALVSMLGLIGTIGLGCHPKRLRDLPLMDTDRPEDLVRADRAFEAGQTAFQEGKRDAALRSFLDALMNSPRKFRAHSGLADVYMVEDDWISSLAEEIAFTETAPESRWYTEHMLVYVFDRFARNPPTRRELGDERIAAGMALVSGALDARRRGATDKALSMLAGAEERLTRFGLPAFLIGWVFLERGDSEQALRAFERALKCNAFFGRVLLERKLEERLSGLLTAIKQVLSDELRQHHADAGSTLVLSAVLLREGQATEGLRILRESLSWGMSSFEILFLKAVAHHLLGETVARDQALDDIVASPQDPSIAFSLLSPSLFHGLLADKATDVVERLADRLPKPAGAYFRWQARAERGAADADAARQVFEQEVDSFYPAGEFEPLPAPEAIDTPGLLEFFGAIRERLVALRPVISSCDLHRRTARARPSGLLTFRVEVNKQGLIERMAVLENPTEDVALAYCMIRKVRGVHLPKPLRAVEVFKLPWLVGPESDEATNSAVEKPAEPGTDAPSE